jgi:hypothetical protein
VIPDVARCSRHHVKPAPARWSFNNSTPRAVREGSQTSRRRSFCDPSHGPLHRGSIHTCRAYSRFHLARHFQGMLTGSHGITQVGGHPAALTARLSLDASDDAPAPGNSIPQTAKGDPSPTPDGRPTSHNTESHLNLSCRGMHPPKMYIGKVKCIPAVC